MESNLAIDKQKILKVLNEWDLSNETELPEVQVYQLSNKSSSGNTRLQVVVNLHDYIGAIDRKRPSFTLDKSVTTNKEIKKQTELLKEYIQNEIADRIKGNTYNLMIPLLDEFVMSKRGKLRDTSVDNYEYRADRIKLYFGQYKDITVEQITPKVVGEFIRWMEDDKKYSYRTVIDTHTLLYGFMKYCIVNEIIQVNPCESTASLINKIPKSNVKDNEFQFLSKEEFLKFYDYCVAYDLDNVTYVKVAMMLYLAMIYGLRKEEVLGLKWDCVDFETGHITIKRTRVKAKKIYDYDDVKNKSSYRQYPMLKEARDIFEQLRDHMNEYIPADSDNFKDSYVFCWDEDEVSERYKKFALTPYRPDYINKVMKCMTRDYKIDCEIDITWLTFHKMRHSCVSLLTLQGWSLSEIQQWVGHADEATTKRIYQHFKPNWADNKTNSLDKLWERHQ